MPFDPVSPVADAAQEQDELNLELMRRMGVFLSERVIVRHNGKLPPLRTIAARVIVLQALIDPGNNQLTLVRSDGVLAAIAVELGCSRAWMSKIALEYSEALGMRSSWQRWQARSTYAKRATAVHAGTYTASDKHERRMLRAESKPTGKKVVRPKAATTAYRQELP